MQKNKALHSLSALFFTHEIAAEWDYLTWPSSEKRL